MRSGDRREAPGRRAGPETQGAAADAVAVETVR